MTYVLSCSVAAAQLAHASKAEIPPLVHWHWSLPRGWEGACSGLPQAPAWHRSLDTGCDQPSH